MTYIEKYTTMSGFDFCNIIYEDIITKWHDILDCHDIIDFMPSIYQTNTLCLIARNSFHSLGPYHVYLKHAYRAPIALCVISHPLTCS